MTTDFRALCAELSDALRNAIRVVYHEDGTQHISTAMPILRRARAALADGPAVLEGREPASATGQPSDGELNRLLWHEFTTSTGHGERTDPIAFARAVLARWGNPAPQPVPVSERLPGQEDCDVEGRCWWLHVGGDGVGDWFQRAPYPSVTSYAFFRMTHWLPAYALPLPGQEVEG